MLQNYLADGTKHPFETSGGSISRKLVSKVFREDCPLEPPDDTFCSLPFSILIASCMANTISCILGLEKPRSSTHCMATSAILQMDSIFTFPIRTGSTMLITSPFRIRDLACKTTMVQSLVFNSFVCHCTKMT